MQPSLRMILFGSATPYRGAMLALDFAGSSRTGRRPYYMLNGRRYARISDIPGWTYTGGTAAGTGSYAARQDGSLQFFPSYTNLILQSQTFDNASWTKTGATVSADVIASPDGTATADKLSEDTSLGAHRFLASQSKAASATTYTFSAYFKAAERSQMRLAFDDGGSNGASAIFDASNGTISTAAAISGDFTSPSATISPISGGWYRATLTATSNTGTTIRYVVGSALAGSFSYQGVSGYGIYIWGAQLELGSTASTYIPTTTAAVTVATPRITDAGYWAEEARTNLQKSSSAFTNTSDWTAPNATVATNAQIAPDGASTSFLVTSTSVNGNRIEPTGTGPAVSASTTYTGSFWLAQSTGRYGGIMADNGASAGAIYDLQNGSVVSTAGTNAISATIVSGPTISGVKWWRCTLTFSTTGAATFVRIGAGVSNGSTYAFTIFPSAGSGAIYAWGAQMELGSFATSPIPTTSVAVTRAADVGYVSGLTFPVPSTALASFNLPYTLATSNRTIIGGGNGLPNLTVGNGSSPVISTSIRNVQGTGTTGNTYSAGTVGTSAFRAQSGSNAVVLNGGTVAASAAAFTALTSGTIGVGYDAFSANNWAQGPIRRFVIYPRAFGNSELQAITTTGAY